MRQDRKKTPLRDLRTYGRGRAVRWDRCTYAGDEIIHLTMCADSGKPFRDPALAKFVCESIEFYSSRFGYRLYGYCLMPEHLHVLLSPNSAGRSVGDWLQAFKSFTSHAHARSSGRAPLWQRSANDHVCRGGETAETVLRYILSNPVRANLVEAWDLWPWSKSFIQL